MELILHARPFTLRPGPQSDPSQQTPQETLSQQVKISATRCLFLLSL